MKIISVNTELLNIFSGTVYPEPKPAKRINYAELPDLNEGDTVNHIKFGKGIVDSVVKKEYEYKATISFEDTKRTLLIPLSVKAKKLVKL